METNVTGVRKLLVIVKEEVQISFKARLIVGHSHHYHEVCFSRPTYPLNRRSAHVIRALGFINFFIWP